MSRCLSPRMLLCAFLSMLALAAPAAQRATDYDVVIRGGRVLDGMGNPWILADVAIADGRFATVGRVTGSGNQELVARGR